MVRAQRIYSNNKLNQFYIRLGLLIDAGTVLYYDYAYKAIKVDGGLVDIHDWAFQSGRTSSPPPSLRSSPSARRSMAVTTTSKSVASNELAHQQVKKVLAIEALGVSDNEVFARAWCAHWGHSAIVANIKETCMACAIR